MFLYAFDLIELNGDDLRRDPLEVRKATLASILAKARPGIRFNEHIEGDGPTVFAHACKLGLEGIVSKRLGSRYVSGRTRDWDAFFASVGDDPVLPPGVDAVREAVGEGLSIVYLTGRPERCRQDTVQWLSDHDLPEGMLLMRPDADRRPARMLKSGALRDLQSGVVVAYVVDDDADREEVVHLVEADVLPPHLLRDRPEVLRAAGQLGVRQVGRHPVDAVHGGTEVGVGRARAAGRRCGRRRERLGLRRCRGRARHLHRPVRAGRLRLCAVTKHVLRDGLGLLGIVAPERM